MPWFVRVLIITVLLFMSPLKGLAGEGGCSQIYTRQSAITDYAGLLSEAERMQLTELISRHRERTGFEIALLIVPSLCGETINRLTRRIASSWQVGAPDTNYGTLVVLAEAERTVGLWIGESIVEGIPLPRLNQLIDSTFYSEIRRGNLVDGLRFGLSALAAESRSMVTVITVPEVFRHFYGRGAFAAQVVFIGLPILFGFAKVTQIKGTVFTRSLKRLRAQEGRSIVDVLLLVWDALCGVFLSTALADIRNWVHAKHAEQRYKLLVVTGASAPTAIAVWIPGTWSFQEDTQKRGWAQLAQAFSSMLVVPGAQEREQFVLRELSRLHPKGMVCRYSWFSLNSQLTRTEAIEHLHQELAALLNAIGPVPIHLVGHSHGGSLACALARRWQPPSGLYVATIGTPFVSENKRSREPQEPARSHIDRATSNAAVTVFTVPVFLVVAAFWWFTWHVAGFELRTLSWIPGPQHWRIIERPDFPELDIAAGGILVTFGAIAVYMGARFFVGHALPRQRQGVLVELIGRGLAQPLTLRIKQDNLLNMMLAAARFHRLRLAVCLLQRRESLPGSKAANNAIWSMGTLFLAMFATPWLYSNLIGLLNTARPGLAIEQRAFAGYLLLIAFYALAACILRCRLLMSAGAIAAEVLWDVVFPFVSLLTFAQSRLAGVPMAVLAAGQVRITDHPGAMPAKDVAITDITSLVKLKHRHSVCLIEPAVWVEIEAQVATHFRLVADGA